MISDLVTTIIPVYNRGDLICEAVQSVLDQTHRPIEIVLVDDGSTDNTPSVIHDLASRHSDVVRLARQQNGGPGLARETGRQLARGEFIQYLDSDDLLLPTKFERQVAALRREPECGIAYCFTRYYRVGESPVDRPWKGSGRTLETMFPSFLVERWWDTPTPLYRRSLCDAVGPWTDLRLEEDWEYDCRAASLSTRLVHCREYLVDVRDHDGARLCKGTSLDPVRNKHRARAHQLIYQHALRAGIGPESSYMQSFARSLFLLARQCGACGLVEESKGLFHLAREASGTPRSQRFDFQVYQIIAKCLGWSAAGSISCWMDHCRAMLRPEERAGAHGS